jgi:hypothetical protein
MVEPPTPPEPALREYRGRLEARRAAAKSPWTFDDNGRSVRSRTPWVPGPRSEHPCARPAGITPHVPLNVLMPNVAST